ncbi:hypothetical protein CUJ83_04830 [Methanocella sp. CWC-04]|uniref:Phage tail tube protein n=1 Tax=Methanooceanicella nereidis TaxID=2052831 RepID=A0AAP2RC26_9EURY|nr:hypothetical protein [Methanocella sp. CWC-04]MCD1294322.1 hypothetical protein [Methanocella sp. CWC-04]
MAISIWSATDSKVLIDSTEVEGLQSLEYKVNRSRSDIIAVGKDVRQGVEYGVKVITGTLKVKSSCPALDQKLNQKEVEQSKFTVSAQLKKGSTQKTVSFQDCYLDGREFSIDVNGVGISIYTFTATDIQES